MSKTTHSEDRLRKHSKLSKHHHHHHQSKHHHQSHKHTRSSMQLGSSSHSPSSSASPEIYTEPGPHGSISVKAIRGSPFLSARSGGLYAIKEDAYVKQVYGADGHQTVVMNAVMSSGLLLRPNIRQAKFQYPDGTFLHCIPMCDVKVLCMKSVYRIGRGREFINSPSEVYGRDSVLLQMRSKAVQTLKRHAHAVYSRHYEGDSMFSFGEPNERNPSVTFLTCAVERHANIVAAVRGTSQKRRLDRVSGWDNIDIEGDVLIALKYVRNVEKRTAEIVFEVQEVKMRRHIGKLFGSSSSS